MNLDTLTRVRLFDSDAVAALDAYVYGGLFAPPEPPRGIDRVAVAEYVLANLSADDSPSVFSAVLETMRFYELHEVADEVVRRSPLRLESADDVRRACYVTQVGVEFGQLDMPERADQYLDRTVIQCDAAVDALDVLLQTRVSVAPRGSMELLSRRIQREVSRRESLVADEDSLLAYDRLAAIASNDLPRAVRTIARKAEIMALDEHSQIVALAEVYLGLADISDSACEVWAARQLRNRVLAGDQQPMAHFAQIVEPTVTLEGKSPGECFVSERAANACVYLGGSISPAQVDMIAGIEAPAAHFLCDEPLGYLERRLKATPRG